MKNKPGRISEAWHRFIYNRFKNNEIKLHELKLILWESTLRCNLNCLHCGSDCSADSTSADMPFKDFLDAILCVKPAYPNTAITVAITGGEPLLRKDLAECGKALIHAGFGWGVVTNGYAYTPQVHARLLDAGMGAISVSLDGLEDSHNWLRNNTESFSRAINAIRIIAPDTDRLNFDIITCVSNRNLGELDRLKELLFSLGVPAWRLYTIAPIGRAGNNPVLQLTSGETKELLDFIARSREPPTSTTVRSFQEEFAREPFVAVQRLQDTGKMDIKFGCEAYTGPYEKKVRSCGFFCRAGINIASVLIDGSIAACPNINRGFIQGSIYNDRFIDIWHTRYIPFRNRRWTRKGPCASCGDFRYCLGGAMHLWPGENGKLMSCLNKSLFSN